MQPNKSPIEPMSTPVAPPSTQSASVQARHRILQKLRQAAPAQALAAPALNAYLEGPYGVGSIGERPNPLTLVSAFEQAAKGWRAEVLNSTPGNVLACIRNALVSKGCERVAVGSESLLQASAQQPLQPLQWVNISAQPEHIKPTLFNEVHAGISVACAGIADTGTLVLQSSPHEPRMLSLVPPISVVLLNVSQLYASLPAAMQALQPQAHMPTNLLLVTGPSKTADIQQTLAYGAHGPKELVIVLIDDVTPTNPDMQEVAA
jgi:L-lactate dehydrogenase complex protein LldG